MQFDLQVFQQCSILHLSFIIFLPTDFTFLNIQQFFQNHFSHQHLHCIFTVNMFFLVYISPPSFFNINALHIFQCINSIQTKYSGHLVPLIYYFSHWRFQLETPLMLKYITIRRHSRIYFSFESQNFYI